VQEFVAEREARARRDHVRLVRQLRDDAHPDGDVRASADVKLLHVPVHGRRARRSSRSSAATSMRSRRDPRR
jgi:hypothetical protein